MSDQDEIIEHVVLFSVKPDVDSSKVAAMVNELNGLTSLDLTIHLSAGEILSCQSSSSLTFTHILHSRYRSMDHLRTYAVHPEHVRVVTETKPIIDDIMAVDWISNVATVSPKPGSAMRVTFLKLKDNLGENEKYKVLDVIKGIKNEFEIIQELSFGENFSHDRAKGYSIASIAVVPGHTDLEALDSNVILDNENVKDLIESVMVIDYVCGSTSEAS